MCNKLTVVVLVLGLAGISQATVFSDNFDHVMTSAWDRINYQGWYAQSIGQPYPGGPWTIGAWDGYQSLADLDSGKMATMEAYNFVDTFNAGMGEAGKLQAWTPDTAEGTPVANGVLRITSSGAAWADQGNTGPFLYKNVTGDFVAQVEVVSSDQFWHNVGGLMARAPNPDEIGANENWVYLTYFPVWGVGNHIRDTINGASTESGIKGYPCDPFLELSRVGNTFYFRTSADGATWASLPGLEAGVVRDDAPAELQVGIFHANYTADWIGTMDFDNFSVVPEPATIALLSLGGLALIRRKRG
jgi:hypothetical protein